MAFTDGEVPDVLAGAAKILPGRRIVPIRLDLNQPLLSPAAAYTSIDLLLLGPAAVSQIRESTLATLTAGGVAVAIQSDQRPQGEWPGAKSSFPAAAGRPSGGCWNIRRSDRGRYRKRGVRANLRLGARLAAGDSPQGRHDRRAGGHRTAWRVAVAVEIAALLFIACAGMGTAAVLVWNHRLSPLLAAGGAAGRVDGSLESATSGSIVRPCEKPTLPCRGRSARALGRHGW